MQKRVGALMFSHCLECVAPYLLSLSSWWRNVTHMALLCLPCIPIGSPM